MVYGREHVVDVNTGYYLTVSHGIVLVILLARLKVQVIEGHLTFCLASV